MKTRMISLLLVVCMLVTLIPAVFASDVHYTQSDVQERLMALQDEFYEGRPWSNNYPYYYKNPLDYSVYWWNGGTYWWNGPIRGGYGCLAFVMEVSDRVFGDLPARMTTDVRFDEIRIGDIITLQNSSGDNHSIIVTDVLDDCVVIAEANFSKNYGPRSVHWGRQMSRETIENAYYMLTRYPEGPEEFYLEASCNGNGAVSLSSDYAFEGDTVTLTVTPDNDYEVSAVFYEGVEDLEIQPAGGEYSFTMPSSNVEITVEFSKIPPTPFLDVVEGKFYVNPVLWAVENNITSGTSTTTFSPDQECTRGQVVTFLWRTAGKPEPVSTEHPFTDVRSNAFYYKAMLWAVENGITSGKTATTFAPDAACSRAEVVTFLWRAAGKPAPASMDCAFTDVKTGGFYYKAMLWAVENNITKGMTKTTFEPNSICNRGQVVTFLYRDVMN